MLILTNVRFQNERATAPLAARSLSEPDLETQADPAVTEVITEGGGHFRRRMLLPTETRSGHFTTDAYHDQSRL
jgi:hypothetical protein